MLDFVSLHDTWWEYLERSKLAIEGYEQALKYDPYSEPIMEAIVDVCKGNIEGWSYLDEYDLDVNGLMKAKVTRTNPDYETWLKTKMDKYVARLKQTNPSYQPPIVEKAKLPQPKGGGCFVATATLGAPDHPVVTVLRTFRDTWLLNRKGGTTFVRHYYKYGPYVAAFIGKTERVNDFETPAGRI